MSWHARKQAEGVGSAEVNVRSKEPVMPADADARKRPVSCSGKLEPVWPYQRLLFQ